MAMSHALKAGQATSAALQLDDLVLREGSASHAHILSRKLVEGRSATRNLADAVHFFGILHGRHPSLADQTADHLLDAEERHWAEATVHAFARERAYLSALAAAAGPMPSTPGQQNCEQAVVAQAHAIHMLGSSERRGCALGATIALSLDWRAVRTVLDAAGARLDVPARPAHLPDLIETAAIVDRAAADPLVERAMMFGAQQLLSQHRGLWDLLAARHAARIDG